MWVASECYEFYYTQEVLSVISKEIQKLHKLVSLNLSFPPHHLALSL